MKKILFIITGGIAAYKVLPSIRYQMKQGNEVRVVMTKMATKFITPLTLETLTNHSVMVDFSQKGSKPVAHVELADWAELVVVAPTTANFIGKVANGLADDFATTVFMASHGEKLIIPAMNTNMWMNPAVQSNIDRLKQMNIQVLDPIIGELAEGYSGKGRFPDELIVNQTIDQTLGLDLILKGKRILVTAGGTREAIDPVRYIGNRSSGKMGYALAEAARKMGAEVTLISAPTKLTAHNDIKVISIVSVKELQDAINQNIVNADVFIMAAAVSDYRVAEVADHKLKKKDFDGNLTLNLVENPDILANLKRPNGLKLMVGFAAESENLSINAQAKLKKKHLDMIVANNIASSTTGFEVDDNAVEVYQPEQEPIKFTKRPKVELANDLLKIISTKL